MRSDIGGAGLEPDTAGVAGRPSTGQTSASLRSI
jgi:hypothetical protein